jgi:DNA-binding transcriptional ArsR family regulator
VTGTKRDDRDTIPTSVTRPSPERLQDAAATFGLLASTMRLHIVWVLTHGECDVGGLAEHVGGTLQAVSQHLAKLKLGGLVRSRREGRHQVYLVGDPEVAAMVERVVDGRLPVPRIGGGYRDGVGA